MKSFRWLSWIVPSTVVFHVAINEVVFAQQSRPFTAKQAAEARMLEYSRLEKEGETDIVPPSSSKRIGFSPASRQFVERYRIPSHRQASSNHLLTASATISSTSRMSATGTSTLSDSVATSWINHYASGLAPSYDAATAMAVDSLGNVYVTGYSTGSFSGQDYATIKYDPSGSLQWVARYDGPESYDDYAADIAVDLSGGVYVTGTTAWKDMVTIKYNSYGIQQWVARYDGPENSYDYAIAVAVDTSGNVYVAGSSRGECVIIKYNYAGMQEWESRYTGGFPTAMAVDPSGNVYVTGSSYAQSWDFATIKLNTAGIIQWIGRFDGLNDNSDYAVALALDSSGNVFVTGESWSYGTVNYATIKYNNRGNEEWRASYGALGSYDYPSDIAVDGSGNVIVTGTSVTSDTTSVCSTIRYDATGAQKWASQYGGANSSWASSITTDTAGNVYVTGGSGHFELDWGSYFVPDSLITIKYDTTGIEQWVGKYDSPGNREDFGAALAVDRSANVYIAGYSVGMFTFDYTTIKYDPTGTQQWVDHYSGPGTSLDHANAMTVDRSGNVYVTGSSEGVSTSSDYASIKYDGGGTQRWVSRYTSPGFHYDYPNAITVDESGNVLVAGQSWESDTSTACVTVKYDAAGVEQWVVSYNFAGYSTASAIATSAAGDVYVTGSSLGQGTLFDYMTIKYNAAGIQQWAARYDGPANTDDYAYALAVDANGNVYVTGTSAGNIATVMYDSLGMEQWVARYIGPANGYDYGAAIVVDPRGHIYITGESRSSSFDDFVTIRYDPQGTQKWDARYNGPSNSGDWAADLAVDSSGNVFVTGTSMSFSTGADYAIIKYDSLGTQKWIARYDGLGYDHANDLALDIASNVYVTGSSGSEFATVAYDSAGNQQWTARYKAPGNTSSYSTAIGVSESGNVFVTGSRTGGSWSVYTTIKYDQALSAPSIALLSPMGGESWAQGTTHEIRWNKKGLVDSVRIEYTTDNGNSWVVIATSVPAVSGRFVWTVPIIPPTQARIRITWITNGQIYDQNDNYFTIVPFSAGPWFHIGTDMGPIWAVAINPTDQRILYAGSNTSGMWKSIDGGSTWSQINNGLFNLTVQACVISRSNPDILYCGTSSNGQYGGVYKSTNGGMSWSSINSGITENPMSVQALAVDPSNPNIAFVAVFSLYDGNAVNGIYKTTNGGETWFVSNSGIGPVKNFLSFAINPLNPNVIYAGSSFNFNPVDTNQARIYKSVNGGNTWNDVSNGLPRTQGGLTHNPIRALSMDRSDTSRILAGVFLNDPAGGAFLTTNGGASWAKISNGLPASVGTLPRSVLIRPGSTTEYFIGFGRLTADTGVGIYRTTNAGQNWQEFNEGDLSNTTTVRALGFRGFQTMELFAAGAHPYEPGGQGVFKYQFIPTAVEEVSPAIPKEFTLWQNYPNPFNPVTRIKFDIARSGPVILKVFNILGQEVVTLVNESLRPGSYETTWQASDAPSGVYFYRLQAGELVETKKLVLLR